MKKMLIAARCRRIIYRHRKRKGLSTGKNMMMELYRATPDYALALEKLLYPNHFKDGEHVKRPFQDGEKTTC